MTTQDDDLDRNQASIDDRSRRDFVALSTAAGVIAATRPVSGAELQVVEKDVDIRTPDGTCDAAFIYPATGQHPGVLIWTDIFGLRPVFREFGKRLAAEGYAVLVPNPFYRTAKAPVISDVSSFNFQDPASRAKLTQFTGPINAAGAIESDAKAYVAYLGGQHQVSKTRKMGTQGYCMGGPLVVKTAAAVPDRIGAGASFHGGGLVTDKPDSPHLLIPKMKSRMYLAVAASDDTKQPDAKDTLRKAFADAHLQAEVTVYPGTIHGWCVRDMPPQNGKPIYSRPDAERAWGHLLSLYKTSLA